MKLKTRLAGLDHLRFVMGRNNKKTIVEGVFNSTLCYCLPLFGGCNVSEVHALQVQQNRAARIVLNLPPRTNRDHMFAKLGWMTVKQLIVYHILIMVFRIRHAREPEYLVKMLKQDNRLGNIIVENSKLGLFKKSFVPRGSTLWNKLPKDLKIIQKVARFKNELRKWIDENVEKFPG